MIKKGEPWGRPSHANPDLEVHGDDRDLAMAVAAAPGALVRFVPTAASDLARAVGIAPGTDTGTELDMDVLELDPAVAGTGHAVNMLVFGTPPDRLTRRTRSFEVVIELERAEQPWFAGPATTVVIAVGQYRHGVDVVPRGHPGDGRGEVQAYALRPGERRAMRRRLADATHLPHPRIPTRTARTVTVRTPVPVPVEVDGRVCGDVSAVVATLRSGGYRLLV